MLTLIAWCWTDVAAAQVPPPAVDPEEIPAEELPEEPPVGTDTPLERQEPEPTKLGVMPGVWAGAAVGVVSPTSIFEPGGLLRIEAGLVPVKLGAHVQPIVALTLGSPGTTGVIDEGEDQSAVYEAHQRTTTVLAGVNVRLFSAKQLIAPEIGLAPAYVWTRTKVKGSLAGEAFSPTADNDSHVSLLGWAGIAGRVGEGQLVGQLTFCRIGLKSPITGEGHLNTVTPTVGYRMTL